MDELTQLVMQQLSDEGVSKISDQIGTDKKTASTALSTAIPLLVSALAKNASKPEGAESLHQALAEDHDGSILDNLSGFLSNPQTDEGAGILGHVLGEKQPAVKQGLSQGTGLDSDQIGQLLQIIAPLVMGALGRQRKQQNLDTNNLSSFLGSQTQKVQESNPDMMSSLNSLLDMDQDGSSLDDILGMASKLFGGK